MAQINNGIYETLGERWYTAYDDPVALLRAESKVKAPWVVERIRARFGDRSIELLDVGCGAGFLTNELATQNFHITGLDSSVDSLRTAGKHDPTGNVRYVEGNAYELPFANQSFDAVAAMDFLEHVESPQKVIQEIARVLRPGGLFFFHTFNRNPVAHFMVIKLVEWLVKNTPKDMHVIDLFIKPKELRQYCEQANLEVIEMTGIRPVWSSIPLKNIWTGVVPESLRFQLTGSTLLSYMGYAALAHPSAQPTLN